MVRNKNRYSTLIKNKTLERLFCIVLILQYNLGVQPERIGNAYV